MKEVVLYEVTIKSCIYKIIKNKYGDLMALNYIPSNCRQVEIWNVDGDVIIKPIFKECLQLVDKIMILEKGRIITIDKDDNAITFVCSFKVCKTPHIIPFTNDDKIASKISALSNKWRFDNIEHDSEIIFNHIFGINNAITNIRNYNRIMKDCLGKEIKYMTELENESEPNKLRLEQIKKRKKLLDKYVGRTLNIYKDLNNLSRYTSIHNNLHDLYLELDILEKE